MQKFTSQNLLVLMLVSILLGGSSIISLGSLDNPLPSSLVRLRYAMIGASLVLLLLISGFKKWNFRMKAEPFFLLWFAYSFTILVSGIANQDELVVREGLWQMVATPLFFFMQYQLQ